MVSLYVPINFKPLAIMKENVVLSKSYAFATRIVKLHLFLSKKQREYELSSQILRSGTSIGANIEEAVGGISRKDFVNKLSIAYKEARETSYWIKLLRDTDIIEKRLASSFLRDCEELLRLLYSIISKNTSHLIIHY
jgi:four helix bundle protein